MTMIACTLNDRFPIIHSDILTSGPDKPDTFYVPALTTNLMDGSVASELQKELHLE
jgi:hypothetical protein